MKKHEYRISVRWNGGATTNYRAYSRNHEVAGEGKTISIPGSSDPHFRGDASRYNPEELLIASLSQCHMLSYLHLCAVNNVVVTEYADSASGTMAEAEDGSGSFTRAVLRPAVTISAESSRETALRLHGEAHRLCFIANSVRFPVAHEASIRQSGV